MKTLFSHPWLIIFLYAFLNFVVTVSLAWCTRTKPSNDQAETEAAEKRKEKKEITECLHSLNSIDIAVGKSSVELILNHRTVIDGNEYHFSHHYCRFCGSHWMRGVKFTASEWAAMMIKNQPKQ
jgi:hypothetical protein